MKQQTVAFSYAGLSFAVHYLDHLFVCFYADVPIEELAQVIVDEHATFAYAKVDGHVTPYSILRMITRSTINPAWITIEQSPLLTDEFQNVILFMLRGRYEH